MKKIIKVLAILTALMLTFTVGCSSASNLEFTAAWNGGSDTLSDGVKEVLKYDVTYSDDYKDDSFDFSFGVDKNKLQCTYSGEYSVTLEVFSEYPADVKGAGSDILVGVPNILKLTAALSLDGRYKLNGAAEFSDVYHDDYYTEIYFCGRAAAFTPVYSKSTSLAHVIENKNGFTVTEKSYSSEILYTKAGYTVAVTGDGAYSKEFRRQFKTYLDNAELIFALRSVSISKNEKSASIFSQPTTVSLPVVAVNYGDAKTLTVAYYADATETFSIKYNGADKTPEIKEKRINFILSGGTNSGKSQLVFIQKEENADVGNRALPVKMVTPLSLHSSPYNCIGATVFTLKELTVN